MHAQANAIFDCLSINPTDSEINFKAAISENCKLLDIV